jgi:hypothetical protein
LFKNAGMTWRRDPHRVNVYDFRSLAKGIAIPYGIYDPRYNRGYVSVGTSADTVEFAVDAIVWWWQADGRILYPPRPPNSGFWRMAVAAMAIDRACGNMLYSIGWSIRWAYA